MVLFLWIFYVFSVLCLLCLCASLFICALWSPAGKGLTSWLSFVVSNCEFVPWSGVVLNCIHSWSLHPCLLWKVLYWYTCSSLGLTFASSIRLKSIMFLLLPDNGLLQLTEDSAMWFCFRTSAFQISQGFKFWSKFTAAGFYNKLNVWGSLGLNFDYDGGPIVENGGPIFLYIYV